MLIIYTSVSTCPPVEIHFWLKMIITLMRLFRAFLLPTGFLSYLKLCCRVSVIYFSILVWREIRKGLTSHLFTFVASGKIQNLVNVLSSCRNSLLAASRCCSSQSMACFVLGGVSLGRVMLGPKCKALTLAFVEFYASSGPDLLPTGSPTCLQL